MHGHYGLPLCQFVTSLLPCRSCMKWEVKIRGCVTCLVSVVFPLSILRIQPLYFFSRTLDLYPQVLDPLNPQYSRIVKMVNDSDRFTLTLANGAVTYAPSARTTRRLCEHVVPLDHVSILEQFAMIPSVFRCIASYYLSFILALAMQLLKKVSETLLIPILTASAASFPAQLARLPPTHLPHRCIAHSIPHHLF